MDFITLIIGLLGGISLFMFGMHMMSEGLQKSAGNKMRTVLSSLTKNSFIGLGVGALVTMVIQSSSATSVMLVSFVNSKLMKFKQSLSVLLGAAIGTTITAQLIAFKLTDYSLLIIGLGGFIFLFAKKSEHKNIGEAILGFGILFFGMEIMSDAMKPLRTYKPFVDLLLQLGNPVLGILVGAAFTALIQSSSAFIGIMIVLAMQGLLTIDSSLALLLGANLGTPITAIIASIKTSIESKKVAYALLFYKLIMVLLFVWLIDPMKDLLDGLNIYFSVDQTDKNNLILPREIANAHTIYNVVLAALALPFITPYAKLIDFIFGKKHKEEKRNVLYLDSNFAHSPALALSLIQRELLNMSGRIFDDFNKMMVPFIKNDDAVLETLSKDRYDIKEIRDEIKAHLLVISRKGTGTEVNDAAYKFMHAVVELSHVNDAITKILHRRAEKWVQREYSLSEDSKNELIGIYGKTKRLFTCVIRMMDSKDVNKYTDIEGLVQTIESLAEDSEHLHYDRLMSADEADSQSSKTYLELINILKTIARHLDSIRANLEM